MYAGQLRDTSANTTRLTTGRQALKRAHAIDPTKQSSTQHLPPTSTLLSQYHASHETLIVVVHSTFLRRHARMGLWRNAWHAGTEMISNALTMCIIGLDVFLAHVYVTNHLDIIASAFEQKCAVCLCLCFCFLAGVNSVYGHGSRFERAARTYVRTDSRCGLACKAAGCRLGDRDCLHYYDRVNNQITSHIDLDWIEMIGHGMWNVLHRKHRTAVHLRDLHRRRQYA
jgi:hypothetical protein